MSVKHHTRGGQYDAQFWQLYAVVEDLRNEKHHHAWQPQRTEPPAASEGAGPSTTAGGIAESSTIVSILPASPLPRRLHLRRGVIGGVLLLPALPPWPDLAACVASLACAVAAGLVFFAEDRVRGNSRLSVLVALGAAMMLCGLALLLPDLLHGYAEVWRAFVPPWSAWIRVSAGLTLAGAGLLLLATAVRGRLTIL